MFKMKLNKLFVILVMAIFVIGMLPVTLADQHLEDVPKDKLAKDKMKLKDKKLELNDKKVKLKDYLEDKLS